MTEYGVVPDGWVECRYETDEYDALWASDDQEITVRAWCDGDDRYPIVVEQVIGDDDRETDVQSHAMIEDGREAADRQAIEFMHEVVDGMHRLRTLGVEEGSGFYQFYCVSDSELPDGMTGEQVVDMIGEEPADDDIDELSDDVPIDSDTESTVQIDIFTRPVEEIDGGDDT